MAARLWLILLLALSGFPRPASLQAATQAVDGSPIPACCTPAAVPSTDGACCTPDAPASCGGEAASTCHRSNGPCRCGVRPDAPGVPAAPALPPSSSRDGASMAPAVLAPPLMALAPATPERLRPGTAAPAILRHHLHTRALLGSWRT